MVNEALGGLSGVLVQIADQLERRHKDEEYVKLYEAEKKRYMGSKAARKARRTFEEWKGYACYGYPQLENIEEYRVEKLLDMDGENPATLAKYLGMGKKQPYADWIVGYVKGASSD